MSAGKACVSWQAARAARARAIAAWASDLLSLRRCGVTSDSVSFTGFGAEALSSALHDAD